MYLAAAVLVLLAIVGIQYLVIRSERPLVEKTEGHWHKTVEGLFVATPDFYTRVEEKLSAWEVPDVEVRRVEVAEGSSFGDKRLYLRVRRGELSYDIFAAPFGGGLFVSSWLWSKPGLMLTLLSHVPLVGQRMVRFFDPETYYALDTATLFQETTHGAVLSALDDLIASGNAKPITDTERKPIMRDLYAATIVPRKPALR